MNELTGLSHPRKHDSVAGQVEACKKSGGPWHSDSTGASCRRDRCGLQEISTWAGKSSPHSDAPLRPAAWHSRRSKSRAALRAAWVGKDLHVRRAVTAETPGSQDGRYDDRDFNGKGQSPTFDRVATRRLRAIVLEHLLASGKSSVPHEVNAAPGRSASPRGATATD
jgi:hypothetical protein